MGTLHFKPLHGFYISNPCMDFTQSFWICLSQEELELNMSTPANNCCHSNTFTLFLLIILPVFHIQNPCTYFNQYFQYMQLPEELEDKYLYFLQHLEVELISFSAICGNKTFIKSFCLKYYMRTEWLFYQNEGLYFSRQKLFLLIKWVHNDFMYVRFAGMRNTKTWSKSRQQVLPWQHLFSVSWTCMNVLYIPNPCTDWSLLFFQHYLATSCHGNTFSVSETYNCVGALHSEFLHYYCSFNRKKTYLLK